MREYAALILYSLWVHIKKVFCKKQQLYFVLPRKLWTIGSEVVVWMVAKGNYLCEVFEKKVPIIIQAQMGKLTNCIFLLFDGTNVHVPIPIAILATAILASWLGLYRFYFGYKKNHGFCMNKIWSNLIVYFWIHFLFLWLIL